jgi:two-component system sensor histidine kinase DegS
MIKRRETGNNDIYLEVMKMLPMDSSDSNHEKYVNRLSVIEIQEEERSRIARDLHDSSLQTLASLVHRLELASLYIDQDPIKAKLELAVIEKNMREIIDDVRNTIFNLRPMSFDDFGIKETLEKVIEFMNIDSKFEIITDIDNIEFDSANPDNKVILISIYRIIQECILNSIKHSQGTLIKVNLKQKNDLYEIIVEDDGIGFDIEEAVKKNNHFGLSVVEERVQLLNGKIEITSNNGTFIKVEIPSHI